MWRICVNVPSMSLYEAETLNNLGFCISSNRKRWWCWREFCSRLSNSTCRWSTLTCSCCATSSSSKVSCDKNGSVSTQSGDTFWFGESIKNLMHVFVLVKGEKNKVCKVLQMAWTFVNDRWAVNLSCYRWLLLWCPASCGRMLFVYKTVSSNQLAGKRAQMDVSSSKTALWF